MPAPVPIDLTHEEAATSSRLPLLILVCIAQFMLVIDDTIVNVALPTIGGEMRMGQTDLSWITNAYLLTFGGFLLIGGCAADLFGRRRMFAFSMAAFFIASAACGLASSPTMLIIARGAQGLAGAMLSPAALSLLLAAFTGPRERTRALAMWSALLALGASTGLLLGGVLVDFVDWRWVFWINLPVGLIALGFVRRILPSDEFQVRGSAPNVLGATLITTAMLTLVYTVVNTTHLGWTGTRSLVGFSIAAALTGAFALHESRTSNPLLPESLVKQRHVAWSNALMFLAAGSLLAMFFMLTLYMQNILRYSPVQSGMAYLPFSLIMLVSSVFVSRAIERFSLRPFLFVGPMVGAIGLLMMSQLTVHSEYITGIFPALVVAGTGIGLTLVPLMEAGTSGATEQDSGIASGALTSAQQVGGAIGIATMIAIATSTATDKFASGATVPSAMVAGFERSFLIAAFTLIGAGLLGAIAGRTMPRNIETQLGKVMAGPRKQTAVASESAAA